MMGSNVAGQTWMEMNKSTPPDRLANDIFGTCVAMSPDFAMVGAPQNDFDSQGATPKNNAGGVYVYGRQTDGKWVIGQKLTASDRAVGDAFGTSVAISGNYAAIGAPQEDQDAQGTNTMSAAGSVYIFEKNGSGQWVEMAKLVASDRNLNDQFGYSVGISGGFLIVGARFEDEDAIGANLQVNSGSVYIFERQPSGQWIQIAKICASDRWEKDQYGTNVAISGNFAAVGARFEDEDSLGLNTLVSSGSVYLLERNALGSWAEVKKITARDRAAGDLFGASLSLDGNTLLVGSYQEDQNPQGMAPVTNAGSAYFFQRDNQGQWRQFQKIVANDRQPSDHFGFAVSLQGNSAYIGARFEDEDALLTNTISGAGSTYVFKNLAGIWLQEQKVVASDRAINDNLGFWVAGYGDYLVSAAKLEDEDALGQNTANSAGSVYFYERCTSPDTPQLSSAATQFCSGSPATIQIIGSKGSANYWYLRRGNCNSAPIDSTTGSTFNIMVNASDTWYVQAAGGCTGAGGGCTPITFTVLTTPTVTASADLTLCSGDSAMVSATSTSPVMWTGGVSNGVPFLPSVGTHLYIASATDVNGCTGSDTVNVVVNALPNILISGNTNICLGNSTVLTGTNAISWVWNTGATSTSITVSPTSNTTYTVEGTDANGCTNLGVVTVMVSNASIDTTVSVVGGTLTANQGGVSYQWINCATGLPISGATSASYSPTTSGSYAVTLTGQCTNQSGCHSVILTGLELAQPMVARVWPNPGTERVHLQTEGTFSYLLLDATGREVLAGQATETAIIPIGHLSAGVYHWRLLSEKGTWASPWIKN